MSSTIQLGTVETLYRYPVKAILGEDLDAAWINNRGVEGDRHYAIYHRDGKIGTHKHSGRFRPMRGLFELKGRIVDNGQVEVTFPDGTSCTSDESDIHSRLSHFTGADAQLRAEGGTSLFDAGSVHIVNTASLDALQAHLPTTEVDARRFRPNIVVKTAHGAPPEEEWLGGILAIGDVRLLATEPTGRCIMTTLPQHELGEAPNILHTLKHGRNGLFGIYADVMAAGAIRVGDAVQLTTA